MLSFIITLIIMFIFIIILPGGIIIGTLSSIITVIIMLPLNGLCWCLGIKHVENTDWFQGIGYLVNIISNLFLLFTCYWILDDLVMMLLN